DYHGALAELEIARRALPNDPRLFELTGYILRRRGQPEEGLRNLERAAELDPRNFFTLQQIALSYQGLGRYAEAIAALDRASAIVPDHVETRTAQPILSLLERRRIVQAQPDYGPTFCVLGIMTLLLAQRPGAGRRSPDNRAHA